MGDSDLTKYLGAVGVLVIVTAFLLAAVAWRVSNRTVRISIGVGLVLLGLFCGVISLAAFVVVDGLGVAIFVLGVRTRHTGE